MSRHRVLQVVSWVLAFFVACLMFWDLERGHYWVASVDAFIVFANWHNAKQAGRRLAAQS